MCVWVSGFHAVSHFGSGGDRERGNSLSIESQSSQMGLLAEISFPAARSPAETWGSVFSMTPGLGEGCGFLHST